MYNIIINYFLLILMTLSFISLLLAIYFKFNFLRKYFLIYDIENYFYTIDDAIRSSCKAEVGRTTILNITLIFILAIIF